MTKYLWAMLIALFSLPALAQLTPGTACGAAGVGYLQGPSGRPVMASKTAEQATKDNTYVAPNGEWTVCPEPGKPPEPKPCAVDGSPPQVSWTGGGAACNGGSLPGLRHGENVELRQVFGRARGSLVYQCTDGARTVVRATCKPATHCDYGWTYDRGGKAYAYDGHAHPVALGASVDALAADGSKWRLRCVAGDFVQAPQCGPQQVARVYGRQVRTYRYAGPPVDQGAQVRANQVDGDRWTVATCAPGGRLQ